MLAVSPESPATAGETIEVVAWNGQAGAPVALFFTEGNGTPILVNTSLFGFLTGRDLTKVGSLAFMGLIGIILASVVNLFLGSPLLHWVITFVGVAVFVGLIAWDTQKLKEIGAESLNERRQSSAAIQGALALYLDFLNLFLLLLNLFGRRR